MAKWYGMPKAGAPRHTYRNVRVWHAGKQWTATWHVVDGRLIVASAWGSRSETIEDGADPADRATVLLKALVTSRQ